MKVRMKRGLLRCRSHPFLAVYCHPEDGVDLAAAQWMALQTLPFLLPSRFEDKGSSCAFFYDLTGRQEVAVDGIAASPSSASFPFPFMTVVKTFCQRPKPARSISFLCGTWSGAGSTARRPSWGGTKGEGRLGKGWASSIFPFRKTSSRVIPCNPPLGKGWASGRLRSRGIGGGGIEPGRGEDRLGGGGFSRFPGKGQEDAS